MRSPDHLPRCREPPVSGADKKEKQKRGKQQHAGGQQQVVLTGLLFGGGDCNGAGALHRLSSSSKPILSESRRFCKPLAAQSKASTAAATTRRKVTIDAMPI